MTFASTPFYWQTRTIITAIMMLTTRQFCFISNSDNLGATVDLGILDLCLSGNQEFIMEVIQNFHLDFYDDGDDNDNDADNDEDTDDDDHVDKGSL